MNFDSSTTSPYQGQSVTTTGIVIAVLSDGFYIENSSGWDSDTCTSEGTYVYTGSSSSTVLAQLAVQDSVTVTGVVESSNASSHGGEQIAIATPVIGTNVVINSTGNTLPSTVGTSTIISSINDGACKEFSAGSFGQWLPFEGMRINVPSSSTMLVTAGTGGAVTAATQAAASNGNFWATITDSSRLFRSKGIDVLDPAYADLSADLPASEQTWSANPTLLLVNTTALGGTALEASAGTKYTGSSNLIGIVDYHLSSSGYTGLILTADSVTALSSQSGNTPVAATAPSTGEITVAEQNLEQDAADTNGLIATETARIQKLAYAIVNYENAPDVVAVQAATPAALTALVSEISSAYSGPGYTVVADTSAANSADSNGLINAFLVNAGKFVSGKTTVAAQLASATWTNYAGTAGQSAFPRAPQLLKVEIARTGISNYVLYLLNASLLSRADLSSGTLATTMNAQLQRAAQAAALTSLLETMEGNGDHVMVAGGLNSFEFSDGYVDTTGILTGSEVGSSDVWTYAAGYNTTALENTTTTAKNLTAYAADSTVTVNPAASRYSYTENGSAEQPDHILITTEMSSLVAIDYARIGADFPVSATYDTSTVARAAAHDAVLAYLTVPYPTETMVAADHDPTDFDDPVTFTATVQVYDESTSTVDTSLTVDSGTVTFTDTTTGTTLCSAIAVSGGTAQCQYSGLTVATHTIKAAYSGSESGLGFQSSSGTTTQTVNQDATTLTLTANTSPSFYGEPMSFTIAASGAGLYGGTNVPTGMVYLCDVSSVSGCTATSSNGIGSATLSSGSVTFTVSTALAVGTHTLQAYYPGDTDDAAALSGTIAQVVNANASTLKLTATPSSVYLGKSINFAVTAAALSGTPSGSVVFYYGTTVLGSASLSAGVASLTVTTGSSTLPVGSDAVYAYYGGDGTHDNANSNTVTVSVLQTYGTNSTLTCTPNPQQYGLAVVCTDVVAVLSGGSGTPDGTVTFYDGSTTIGTATLAAGQAQLSTSALAVGSHALTAVYAENDPYLSSTSNTVNEIIAGIFTLTATPTSATLYTGESASFSLAVVPGTGFNLDVALSCSGVPSSTTCTITPGTVTGGSGNAAMVIQTTAPRNTSAARMKRGPGAWPLLAGVLVALLPRRLRRRGLWLVSGLLLLVFAGGAMTGCGGAGTLTGGTPAGSYTVTVTGTAQDSTLTITSSTTVTLQVKSMFWWQGRRDEGRRDLGT